MPAVNEPKRALWHLRKMPILAELPSDALQRLAEHVELRELRRRDVVYMPGDPCTSLFFVASGRVKISKITRDGKSLTLAYCGPTELFGDACLVGSSPRTEMAEAVENSVAIAITGKDFEKLLASHARLGFSIAKLMVARRHELENKLEALVFRDVTSKLAEQLLKLSGEYGVEEKRGTMVTVKITHQELANLIGSTRETVSLTLSQFKKRQLIVTEGRKVIISDASALRALF